MAQPLVLLRRLARRAPEYSHLRIVRAGAVGVPSSMQIDSRWVARLDAATWGPDGSLEVRGWAYLKGIPSLRSRVAVELIDPVSGRLARLEVAPSPSPGANSTSNEDVDHTWAGFGAVFEPDMFPHAREEEGAAAPALWARVEVSTREGTFRGPFTQRSDAGPSGAPFPNRMASGEHASPVWKPGWGLGLSISNPAVQVVGAEPDRGGMKLDISATPEFTPVRAALDGRRQQPVALQLESTGEHTWRIRLTPRHAAAGHGRRSWTLCLVDAEGRREPVRWARPTIPARIALSDGLGLEFADDGTLLVDHDPRALIVTSVRRVLGRDPGFLVEGNLTSTNIELRHVHLVGRRVRVPASDWHVDLDGTFTAFVPLVRSAWDGVERPIPSGRYHVEIEAAGSGEVNLRVGLDCLGTFGQTEHGDTHNTRMTRRDGTVRIDVSAPLAPDEIGPFHQSRLRAEARRSTCDLVGTFFESWRGRSASDSPLAIHREMSARGFGAPYFWGVFDLSIAVPPDTVPVVVGSRAWWRAISCSRFAVVNQWQRANYRKRDGQVLVQTWHGTPYKLLGLDRPSKSGRAGSIRKIKRDTADWDYLISQNPYSSEILRRAYLWDRPILETGYPRNDVLARADPSQRSLIRARLSISGDETAVLYAPTWREDNRSTVGVLDVPKLAQALGPGFRVLLRGHAITLRTGVSIDTDAVIDVTTYPDASELMLAADVLVTDYSSIMFDFSVTGRPILFFVPDLADYAGTPTRRHLHRRTGQDSETPASPKFRGAYFDLETLAPGPLLTRQRDLVRAIHELDAVRAKYSQRYAAWQNTFNPHDDGAASRRIVDTLLADGLNGSGAPRPIHEQDSVNSSES